MALVLGTNCGFVTEAPTADPGESGATLSGRAYALKVTAPEGAVKIVEIGWWSSNATEEANFEVGIYEHNIGDDDPEAVVGSLSQTNAKGTTEGWKRVTVDIDISAETIYWIAIQLDLEEEFGSIEIVSDGTRIAKKFSQTTLLDPWGTSNLISTNQLMGIYAVYEAPAGFTRKIKISGTFQDKPIKTKVAGAFEDKPIKIKVGGTFQDA